MEKQPQIPPIPPIDEVIVPNSFAELVEADRQLEELNRENKKNIKDLNESKESKESLKNSLLKEDYSIKQEFKEKPGEEYN